VPAVENSPVQNAAAKPILLVKDDILLADFEGQSYDKWKTTGTALGARPTDSKGRVNGHQGQQLVTMFLINSSEKPTGTLVSPIIKVGRRYLHFPIGDGKHSRETGASLLVDGKLGHSLQVGLSISVPLSSSQSKISHFSRSPTMDAKLEPCGNNDLGIKPSPPIVRTISPDCLSGFTTSASKV
jgi:hypothetical protein